MQWATLIVAPIAALAGVFLERMLGNSAERQREERQAAREQWERDRARAVAARLAMDGFQRAIAAWNAGMETRGAPLLETFEDDGWVLASRPVLAGALTTPEWLTVTSAWEMIESAKKTDWLGTDSDPEHARKLMIEDVRIFRVAISELEQYIDLPLTPARPAP